MTVRRRKQLKSSTAGGNRLEPSENGHDAESPLVTLPAEIQGIITSYLVQLRDLNHLCCTCKTLSAAVLPTLYRTIELKVPLQWSRLPSLEKLLASTSEGLKHTRCLRIVAKQYPQEDNHYYNSDNVPQIGYVDLVGNDDESEDEEEAERDETDSEEQGEEDFGIFRIYHPRSSASNSLNAFIRVLIEKLPPQQLHTFWWEHPCLLETLTLSTLLKQQGGSIYTLSFSEYMRNSSKADLTYLTIRGLTTLVMTDLGRVDSWSTGLLARNHQNLRHLRLGRELDLAKEYADSGLADLFYQMRYSVTDALRETMEKKIGGLHEPSTPNMRLESLSLIGLDLHDFALGFVQPVVDFSSLSMLVLESCIGLEEAFLALTAAGTGRRKGKSALQLHTLAIRHEQASEGILRSLEMFLLSLKPLTHLHILLEGQYTETIEMRKVLQIHGKRLQSLVYDERESPRHAVECDWTFRPADFRNLMLVAQHCPSLKALGISLNWGEISRSEENQKKIASAFSRLTQLQTLNIRNLPVARRSQARLPWLPTDYMMEGLGTMLINIITKNARLQQPLVLKTLAIGASTYGNVRMGMNHYTETRTSTLLQLRIYHVNYDCRHRNSLLPKLQLIARGTPADARGDAENLDIFRLYWLDGFPKDRP